VQDPSQPLFDIAAEQREAVVQKWLTHTLRTYPSETSRFMQETRDPFHNPVGRALKEGLPQIFAQLIGEFDARRIEPALDDIVRIRAIQDFSASQAIGFIFHLKEIIREELSPEAPGFTTLQDRIDKLALLAFDIYMKCREKSWQIQVKEARSRVYVLEKVASRKGRSSSAAPDGSPVLPAN
jgi:RsbRD-like negative regulator of sigma factor